MSMSGKYDRVSSGVLTGFLLPVLTGFAVYLFASGGNSLPDYFKRIISADILTHIISLCVLPNLVMFLIFNRLDMLLAVRGILGITIFWAVVVFAVKFFL